MVHNYALEFTVAIAVTFVCYAIYTFMFTRRRVAFQRAVNALEAQSDDRLVDSLLNYDTVKYFATEETETHRLSEVLEKWVHARTANQRALTALHVGQSTLIALGIAAIMLLAAQHVVGGSMSVGDLILVNAYIVQICMPLNTLGLGFRETNDALVAVERMFIILGTQGRVGEDIDAPASTPRVVSAGFLTRRRTSGRKCCYATLCSRMKTAMTCCVDCERSKQSGMGRRIRICGRSP
jgi:ATP-binding cassette subfamily B protein